MAYKRKTYDVWELQGYYDGWAFILYEFSFKEAKKQLNDELATKGYLVVNGKTNRDYFYDRIYRKAC